MNTDNPNKYRLLLTGMLIIAISIIYEFLQVNYLPDIQNNIWVHSIQKEVFEKEQISQEAFDQLTAMHPDEYYTYMGELLEISKEKRVFFYIFQNSQLVLWTSNKVIPDKIVLPENEFRLQRLSNGYYLQANTTHGNFNFVCLVPVETAYPYENNYLKNIFLLGKGGKHFKLDFHATGNSNSTAYNIYNKKNDVLFKLTTLKQEQSDPILIILYLLGGLIVFIYINKQVKDLLKQKNYIRGLVLLFSTVAITYLGWKVLGIPKVLFTHEIFLPIVYASSNFLASIGDFFLAVFLFAWIINTISPLIKPVFHKGKTVNIFATAFLFFLLMLFMIGIVSLINGMVVNSSIPMDMSQFFLFNFYSILAFLIIFLLLFIFLKIASLFVSIIRPKGIKSWIWIPTFAIPCLLFYFVFRHSNNYSYLLILYPLLTWILYAYYGLLEKLNLNSLLAFILISSGFVAHQIISANEVKEKENRKLLITSIASDRDAIGEQLILEQIDGLKNDNYLKSYFSNPLISKSLLKKRLKQVYFSGYFSNYDMVLNTYTVSGEPFKSISYISMASYCDVISNSLVVDSNRILFFRNTYDGAPVYLINLSIKREDHSIGQIIVELKKKPFLEESVYPELIIEQNIKRSEELKNYSYAIYINQLLSNQKGEYSYPITFSPDKTNSEIYSFFSEGKYDHLLYRMNDEVIIIMSKQSNNIFTSLALFSVLFILSTIILAISFYILKILNVLDLSGLFSKQFLKALNPVTQMYFKSKIQLTILISIFFALLLTGYASIRFISINSNKNIEIKLQKEIKIVTESLFDYFDENSVNGDDLYSRIINAADLFRTDINIFDRFGVLTATSQMPVYERHIISQMIDAEAFYNLWILQKSQLVQYEKIGGRIKYLSAYSPIRNSNNEIIGFINIPYFAKEKETKEEITNLIVTLVNIYVFLFLLIILISILIANTFTEPLEIIRNHLGDLQLGRTNKKILWKSEDEIGSLINEYNQMLIKVEESALAMARSERESAWREMAKQVAHEIKNPLTPMKLNLQQLLRAWENKDEDLEERFKKTTQILINRIDTLSAIATEFSAFARMPEARHQEVNLEKVLLEVKDFYEATDKILINLNLTTRNTKILGDESQLNRAFNNLVRNAFQATPEEREAKVEISTELKFDTVVIGIKDNGKGIPEDLRDKIFLPNFSTKSSGMGLGLAIVSRIITSLNGKIWYETLEQEGTTFFISFPVYNKENQANTSGKTISQDD
ncbi:ATP-binding protein [Bacteroidota bacterium]